jgi:hypothetical protein
VLAYTFKSKFFEEEKEWRVYSIAPCANGRVSIPSVEFLSTTQLLKPFVKFPQAGFSTEIVREVILGPRNRTPLEMVRLFLDEQGFTHVKVTPSSGTYQ